ncbi:MAG: response regulator, partial [Eubacterium sp.]
MPKRKCVLIVDDRRVNRLVLSGILKEDYTILEAENGKIALDILHQQKERIAAILLDITMPVMNGYEVMTAMSGDTL